MRLTKYVKGLVLLTIFDLFMFLRVMVFPNLLL